MIYRRSASEVVYIRCIILSMEGRWTRDAVTNSPGVVLTVILDDRLLIYLFVPRAFNQCDFENDLFDHKGGRPNNT